MGHRRMQYLNEMDVSERDLLVGDCRHRRWSFISCLDFGSVLGTQKDRQVALTFKAWRCHVFAGRLPQINSSVT